MNYWDLLPNDFIEIINKELIELQNKESRKIRKETKRAAKQYNFCEKRLKKLIVNMINFRLWILYRWRNNILK